MNAWDRSNRFNLIFIRMTIISNINTLLLPTTSTQGGEFYNKYNKFDHNTSYFVIFLKKWDIYT